LSRIIQIKAHRAGSIGDHCAPLVYLTIGDEMPELGKMTLADFDAIFQSDAEAIEKGYVPGMRLAMNARGREIVVHDEGV
jgi:hypothetical protein